MEELKGLSFKPGWKDVVERLRALYERRAGDRIFATMQVPSRTLQEFRLQYPEPECNYPDPEERVDFWDRLFAERSAVEDDSLPCAYLSEFDQGLYGGLLGGDVRFMAHPDVGWISSMVPPLLKDWAEFDRLCFDFSHPWWQRYCRQLDIFTMRSAGRWGISHFILIDALNFVFELVGATVTYTSVMDQPDLVRRAIDLAFDLNMKVQEKFFESVPRLAGGTFSNFAQWVPGRVVSESIDPFHMTSVSYFEQWGREPVERILAAFDGGVIHIHGNGRHLLEAASTIRGLRAMLFLDDRGFPLAFDVVSELKARVGEVPAAVFADHEPFLARLRRHDLPGGLMYQVRNVPDIGSANRCMESVRSYRV